MQRSLLFYALVLAPVLVGGGCSGASGTSTGAGGLGQVSTAGNGAGQMNSASGGDDSVSAGGSGISGGSAVGGGALAAGASAGGSNNAGSSNAGSGNAGSGNAGSSNAGSSNAGSGNAGSGNAGSGGMGGVVKSAGCGKAPTILGGESSPVTIQSNGARQYLLRVPDNYDNTHPYRLVIAYHESGASAKAVWGYDFYKLWDLADNSTIFIAPDGLNGGWSNTNGNDVTLTDAILAQIEKDRCIDTTRIFATGFSFGGAMSIAIACSRADVFRGVAFFSGANLSGCDGGTTPIAYYASQASQDHGSLPAGSPIAGEVIQANFAAVNGCTAQDAPIPATGSGQPHVCTKYQGCSAGHPVEYCGFDGPHGWSPVDKGQTTSWDPPEAWKFITQF